MYVDNSSGYRFSGVDRPHDNGLLINLSFSGGGTRAAALSYGVLQELAKTTTFHLPDEDVDRLTEVAGKILRASPSFAEFLNDLR